MSQNPARKMRRQALREAKAAQWRYVRKYVANGGVDQVQAFVARDLGARARAGDSEAEVNAAREWVPRVVARYTLPRRDAR